ncbi:MAG: hypothetical protein M1836_007236 [Candelina mexicana]|nr:MAG: hypothetical protein M1836_007236 [Candelina mexicana]
MSLIKRRYHALPLIASPLEDESHHRHASEESLEPKGHSALVTVAEPSDVPPAFREKEEASSIELFYDLFFVANLTTFTTGHPIDDRTTLSSYVGFLAILWFTWLQVVLYDVRFGVDSVFERVCKVFHFGVMIAFAVIGVKFDPSKTDENYGTFRKLSVVLVISRLVLMTQYGSLLAWVKHHKKIVTPLLVHIAAFAIGAVVCLGLTFSFKKTSSSSSYITWYVVAVLEAFAVFITCSQWRAISFKHTNLNERCGLLTLIILGEGIIVLTKATTNVVKGENFSAAIIGQIISAVLIIYFLYILYFDQVESKRYGTIRQQFWALSHFPFHIALVLLMEGTSRLITWRNATEFLDKFFIPIDSVWYSTNDTAVLAEFFANLAYAKKDGLYAVLEADASKYNITEFITNLNSTGNKTSEAAVDAVEQIEATFINAILSYFKIKEPKKVSKGKESLSVEPFDVLYNAVNVQDLVMVYFFVAAGLTLIIMGLQIALAKKRKVTGDWAAIALRLVVGLALALVALVTTNINTQQHYLYSPWMLPTVCLGIFIVVILDAVLGYLLPAPKELISAHEHHQHHGEPVHHNNNA